MKSIAIACLAAMPMFAQTATTTTTTTTASSKKTTKATAANHTKVWNDSTRLAAILSDVQNKMNYSADAWKVTVNEANVLANRIYANTGGRSQARELRMHVREMREAALKGDAESARTHAAEAAPFANELMDWAAPKDASSR